MSISAEEYIENRAFQDAYSGSNLSVISFVALAVWITPYLNNELDTLEKTEDSDDSDEENSEEENFNEQFYTDFLF